MSNVPSFVHAVEQLARQRGPRRRPLGILVVILVLALGGCVDAGTTAPGPSPGPAPAGGAPEAPPGCDPARPAIAHGPGGLLVADAAPLTILPCLHPVGAATFEPTIGVGSDGAVYYYPVRPSPEREQEGYGVARSSDGGQTWDVLRPALAGRPTHPETADPYLYVDPGTDRVFLDDIMLPLPNCGRMSFSDNRGETWTETEAGCLQFDHVTIFAGPPRASPTVGYPNVVYRCAISGGVMGSTSTMVTCQRSLDGGLTWLAPGTSPWTHPPRELSAYGLPGCSGGSGHGVADAVGRIYLPRGDCDHPSLAISEDEGTTWRTMRVSELGIYCLGTECDHNGAVSVDAAGTIYYAWIAADLLPYLATSRDGGATWNEPLIIAAPNVTAASHIQIAAGAAGRLAVVYYGTTNAPMSPTSREDFHASTWNAYLGVTYDADAASPTFWTAMLNDAEDPMARGDCGPNRCPGIMDFIDIRLAPDGTPWAPVVDSCTAECLENVDVQNTAEDAYAARLWGGLSLWG